jgi:YD repeat-containing protein
VAHQGGDNGTVLTSENHVFYALDAEYRPCGGIYTGTDNEKWTNAREFRTETQTGTGTVVTVRNWEQRATVSWANDVGLTYNAYAQQHGVDTLAIDDPRLTWEETALEDLKTKRVEYGYDQFNNVTSVKEYDFGDTTGSTGPLLRQTSRRYLGDAAPPDNSPSYDGYCYTNLSPLDPACGPPPSDQAIDPAVVIHQKHLLLSEEVKDGAGSREAYTEYEYDHYRGAPDWNDAPPDANDRMIMYDGARFSAFDATRQPRGHVTATKGWIEGSDAGGQPACTTSVCAVSYTRYDNAGNAVAVKDARGFVSNVSYTDDYGDGTSPGGAAQGAAGATYALPTAAANALGQQSRTQYDFTLGAATGVRDPNGVVTKVEYDQAGRPVKTTAALGLAEQAVAEMIYPTPASKVAKVSRQLDSARWLASETVMDGFDRPVLSATAEDGQKADVASYTVFTKTIYDALGRVKLVTNPYRTQPASTDGWTRTSYDLAGRVTDGPFVYSVSYDYDARGNLTAVHQGEQTRSFSYDGLSRLRSATNPEVCQQQQSQCAPLPVTYEYDLDGNLKKKVDSRGAL